MHGNDAREEEPLSGSRHACELPDLAANLQGARAHMREAMRAIMAIGLLRHPWEERRARALFCCLDALEAMRREREELIAAHWRELAQDARRRRPGRKRGVWRFGLERRRDAEGAGRVRPEPSRHDAVSGRGSERPARRRIFPVADGLGDLVLMLTDRMSAHRGASNTDILDEDGGDQEVS